MFVLVKTNKSCFLDEIDQPMCHPGVRNTITVPTVKIPSFSGRYNFSRCEMGVVFFFGGGGGGGGRGTLGGIFGLLFLRSIFFFSFCFFLLFLDDRLILDENSQRAVKSKKKKKKKKKKERKKKKLLVINSRISKSGRTFNLFFLILTLFCRETGELCVFLSYSVNIQCKFYLNIMHKHAQSI